MPVYVLSFTKLRYMAASSDARSSTVSPPAAGFFVLSARPCNIRLSLGRGSRTGVWTAQKGIQEEAGKRQLDDDALQQQLPQHAPEKGELGRGALCVRR